MLIDANRQGLRTRTRTGIRRRALMVLLGVLAMAGAFCTGAAAAAPAAPAMGKPPIVTVSMVDHRLLQPDVLPAGRYTFRAVNDGRAPHALEIRGPGVSARTPVVQSGQHADLTVTLHKGVYDFWCPVGNHRQMGMQLYVKVV